MKMILNLSIFATTFVAVTVMLNFTGPLLAQSLLQKQVDEQVQPYLDAKILVGLTVGVYHHGESKAFGYGSMNAAADKVPDGSTIYEIGSFSKVFTGLLLADAVNLKVVEINQEVATLLPKNARMPAKGDKAITLRHLSTHTSGLPRLPTNMTPADPENPYADYTESQMFQFLGQCELSRAPEVTSEYSNFAAGLLGQLLANESKSTYQELLATRIAQPLAMNDTTIKLADSQLARLAVPHDAAGNPTKNWAFQAMVGAGGILSTVDDMLTFAKANIHPPKNEIGKAIELAWQVHQTPLKKGDFSMGLGWHVAHDGSTRWHNGQTGGYHSMMFVNRELDLAVVVLTNSASMEVDRLAEDLVRVATGATVKPREFEETKKVAPEILQRYVGRYQLVPEFILTVSVVGEKLMVGATGQPTFEVYPKSDTEWFYKVVEATITFDVDDKGKCKELVLFQNGAKNVAKRIE